MEAAYFFQQLCQSRFEVLILFYIMTTHGFSFKGKKKTPLTKDLFEKNFSSLTLQMFVACRGIPVLVSFLEADYAKYRYVNINLRQSSIYSIKGIRFNESVVLCCSIGGLYLRTSTYMHNKVVFLFGFHQVSLLFFSYTYS